MGNHATHGRLIIGFIPFFMLNHLNYYPSLAIAYLSNIATLNQLN